MIFRFWTLTLFGMAVSEETIPFKSKLEEIPYGVMRVWN